MTILEIKNLTYTYNQHQAPIFQDINLKLEKGDVLCILGPNGTGKTTLLKNINKILTPQKGEILLQNTNIQKIPQQKIAQKIGYIPQNHNPIFSFKVFDVVLMGRAPHLGLLDTPTPEDHQLAENALKEFNIQHLKNKQYTQLSGGEQQLVFFARALVQNPEILLLDEPTSHLDFGNQLYTLDLIKKLSKRGISVIMTSHYPDHAFIAANKTAVMKDKKIIAIGKPEEIITEQLMAETYGIKVKIIDLGPRQKTCIPLKTLKKQGDK